MYTDPLLNPYNPPLRDERYGVGWGPGVVVGPGGGNPVVAAMAATAAGGINIPTNIGAVANAAFRQVGMLAPTDESHKDQLLPLMGRPINSSRNQWQYYTISNQHNNIKLQLYSGKKNCTNEYGCPELSSGNELKVDGMQDPYRVTLYESNGTQYVPW
jgi:hypothetical protein